MPIGRQIGRRCASTGWRPSKRTLPSVEIDRMTPLQIVQLMNAEDADGGRGRDARVASDCGGG